MSHPGVVSERRKLQDHEIFTVSAAKDWIILSGP